MKTNKEGKIFYNVNYKEKYVVKILKKLYIMD